VGGSPPLPDVVVGLGGQQSEGCRPHLLGAQILHQGDAAHDADRLHVHAPVQHVTHALVGGGPLPQALDELAGPGRDELVVGIGPGDAEELGGWFGEEFVCALDGKRDLPSWMGDGEEPPAADTPEVLVDGAVGVVFGRDGGQEAIDEVRRRADGHEPHARLAADGVVVSVGDAGGEPPAGGGASVLVHRVVVGGEQEGRVGGALDDLDRDECTGGVGFAAHDVVERHPVGEEQHVVDAVAARRHVDRFGPRPLRPGTLGGGHEDLHAIHR
jgi:hypothetical protein